jgi:hypothetical protein
MEDDLSFNDDGTITFEFDKVTRVLHRPTLGEYREAVESLGRMRAEAVKKPEQSFTLVLEWFDSIFTTLAGEGLPKKTVEDESVVDDSKLPSWLLSGDLIGEIINHWQTSPNHRGAR